MVTVNQRTHMNRIKYLLLSALTTLCLGLNATEDLPQIDELQKLEVVKGISQALSKGQTFKKGADSNCEKACKKHKKSECGTCGCARGITRRDIRRGGFVIDRPGTYRLEENIDFSPRETGAVAIVIDSDDVILDLCNHSLRLDTSLADTTGILINGRRNVVVENGTVSDFTAFGIRANPGVSTLTLRNLDVLRNGLNDPATLPITAGIAIVSGTVDGQIHDVLIIDVNSSENVLAGLILSGVDNVDVIHSRFNRNTTAVTGFGTNSWGVLATALYNDPISPSVFPCSNLRFIESEMNNNVSTGGAIGIETLSIPAFGLPVNQNVSLVRVTANGNIGGGAETIVNEGEGIVIVGTNNFVVRECIANGNRTLAEAPSGTPGFFASIGFGVPFGSSNGLFVDCVAEGNSGAGDISAGFRVFRSANITINNCEANGNNNTSTGEAWGFTTDPNLGNFAGAFGFPTNVNYLFTRSVAKNNFSVDGIGGGFKFISTINSELSYNHSITNGSTNSDGYGILVGNPPCCATNTCCTADPTVCTIPGTPPTCAPFAVCCPSSHNVINNNELIGNSDYGIYDNFISQGNQTAYNAYYANVARNSGTANYRIPTGNPIRTWPLPASPSVLDNNSTPVLDAQLDNIDITSP